MDSDIEIAQKAPMERIEKIAQKIGISSEELECYGPYKAKISWDLIKRAKGNKKGKLILVTAVSPTSAGEGKTTTTVGRGTGSCSDWGKGHDLPQRTLAGPCMGMKGGAAGGGYSQVLPMEDINLHFTGDIHAVTAAHNLLAAMTDNHIQQGNILHIDPRRVVWKRAVDMNDRVLRQIVVGLGGHGNGIPREGGFEITAASEVMAVLCLASGILDLKQRLARMIVAYTYEMSRSRAVIFMEKGL